MYYIYIFDILLNNHKQPSKTRQENQFFDGSIGSFCQAWPQKPGRLMQAQPAGSNHQHDDNLRSLGVPKIETHKIIVGYLETMRLI